MNNRQNSEHKIISYLLRPYNRTNWLRGIDASFIFVVVVVVVLSFYGESLGGRGFQRFCLQSHVTSSA